MGSAEFRILGPVEVWLGDERLPLGGPRQLALLSFLLLHANRAVSAEVLIEGMWGSDGAAAAKRLSMAIARLRRALEPLQYDGAPVLRTVRGGYLLSISGGELDAERFDRLVQEGRALLGASDAAGAREQLGAALALWRGPALAEVGFEEFAQAEVRRLEELRLLALEARIDADLQLGADAGLTAELGSLLARYPAREHLAGQLMLALYRSGRQVEALEVYQRTRAGLNSDLGLEPGPELRALQTQILEHAPAITGRHAGAPGLAPERRTTGDPVTLVIAEWAGSATELGELYEEIRSGLDELLRRVWSDRAGLTLATHRGGLLAFAESPQEALEAAIEARDAPATVEWPAGVDVRLRIGVHTGQLRVSAGGYWGEDVHYTARLADGAHGGQVLVSGVTASLAAGTALVDLGEHRLTDFPTPRRLFAAGPGPHRLPRTGDPLRSNLPGVPGGLIGRELECAELVAELRSGDCRLVTITGPGGSGKTRLALAVAKALVDDVCDGAFFIELSQVSDAGAVVAAIAAPLGIHLAGASDQAEAIGLALADRQLLLVLDNFEHLLDAAPLIAALLEAAPKLLVMVTSQTALRIRGERVRPLGPLQEPQRDDRRSVGAAAAGRLLLERAQEADPRFQLTDTNAASVARLCRALGCWPLAIELAAARLALLGPDQLLTRLEQGFDAVGRGSRDLPERQRGLRAALDWTHGLLGDEQATLLRRLGVFAGAVSLERIERVCGSGADLLESLAQLVELSLVTRAGDGRFLLHGSVREYAREKLAAAGEAQDLARRHGEVFAEAAEAWGSRFLFEVGEVWSAVLREEADIGEALTWAAATDQECFARLAGGASMPLVFAARLPLWSEQIEHALTGTDVAGRPRTWLLLAASLTAFGRGDVPLSRARLLSAIATAERAGDEWLACLMRASSVIFHVLIGVTDGVREDYSLLSERVQLLRDPEFAVLVAGLEPYILGYCERRYAEAGAIWSTLIADTARTDFARSSALYCWPDCLLLDGFYDAALDAYHAALRDARQRAQAPTVAYQLEGISIALSKLGRHEEALEAAGWAASVRQTAGPATNAWYKELFENELKRSRSALGTGPADAAYTRGRALALDAAVNAALDRDRTVPAARETGRRGRAVTRPRPESDPGPSRR